MQFRTQLSISLFAVIGSSIFITPISKANPSICQPQKVLADYQIFIKGGASPSVATELAISENGNDSAACKYKINAALVDAGLQPYFFRKTLNGGAQTQQATPQPIPQQRPVTYMPSSSSQAKNQNLYSTELENDDIRDSCSTSHGGNGKGKMQCLAEQRKEQRRSRTKKTQSTKISRSCPSGTSYHNIKAGGLLFKRTVAEGCYTDFQASQLRMQADSNQRQKMRDFQSDNNSQNCTTSFIGNTAYTNCY